MTLIPVLADTRLPCILSSFNNYRIAVLVSNLLTYREKDCTQVIVLCICQQTLGIVSHIHSNSEILKAAVIACAELVGDMKCFFTHCTVYLPHFLQVVVNVML